MGISRRNTLQGAAGLAASGLVGGLGTARAQTALPGLPSTMEMGMRSEIQRCHPVAVEADVCHQPAVGQHEADDRLLGCLGRDLGIGSNR